MPLSASHPDEAGACRNACTPQLRGLFSRIGSIERGPILVVGTSPWTGAGVASFRLRAAPGGVVKGLCPATGKQRHVSRAAARQHLSALYRSKNVRDAALLTPFRCSSCSAWHLGHRR